MAEVDSCSHPLSLTKNNGGQTAVHVFSQLALIEQRVGEVNVLQNETKLKTLRVANVSTNTNEMQLQTGTVQTYRRPES